MKISASLLILLLVMSLSACTTAIKPVKLRCPACGHEFGVPGPDGQ